MDKQFPITLGSLFDGIGGFPYAASFFGIKASWASEILPTAISVTRRHIPGMEHMGDITELHGGNLPPVDIITFGSPCQGLSAAGKRKGFSDPRSGLFIEAIRIIREMREATNGKYPTWAVWENVPGALSSNRGLDYKGVLEAFTETEVPFPRSGRWTNAGMVRGRGTDLAWCVYNAQYFGTAQRRRRIFLVCDFGGKRAGEILFIPKSLRGYFAAGGTPRKNAAAHAVHGIDGAMPDGSVGFDGYNGDLTGSKATALGVNCGMSTGRNGVVDRPNCLTPWDLQQSRIFTENGAAPTLAGADGGGGRNPGGLVYTAGFNPGADAKGVHQNQCGDVNIADSAYSLSTNSNATGRNAPLVCTNIHAFSLDSTQSNSMKSSNPHSGCREVVTAKTVDTTSPCPSKNQGGIAVVEVLPMVSGTLCASGAGLTRPAGMASETDLCVVVPNTEAIPIHEKATRYNGGGDTRNNDGSGNGLGVGRCGDPAPTITAGDRHAVAAVDCRNYKEVDDLSGTLQAKSTPGYSLNYQNPIRMGYIVRRLTPMECERLQGYPDGWTAFGHDMKPTSDTARYMMLGNSVAVPCVAYILMGIAAAHRKEVIYEPA